MFVRFTMERPHDVGQHTWRRLSKAAMLAVGLFFEREIKSRKFTKAAETVDRHKPRSPGYLKRKNKPYRLIRDAATGRLRPIPNPAGGQPNLIATGETRRAVMRPHLPRAFPTRVTIDFPTPRYVQMRPYRRNAPNLGAEILAVTRDEIRQLGEVYQQSIESELDKFRATRGR